MVVLRKKGEEVRKEGDEYRVPVPSQRYSTSLSICSKVFCVYDPFVQLNSRKWYLFSPIRVQRQVGISPESYFMKVPVITRASGIIKV